MAHRAGTGHEENFFHACPATDHRSDYFGYHLAGALHQHPVPDAYVLAVDIIFIVQRSPLDGDAPDIDWFEYGIGVEAARPADVDANIQQAGGALDSGEFICDGPARVVADKAQLFLQRDRVNLDDHAIDIIR